MVKISSCPRIYNDYNLLRFRVNARTVHVHITFTHFTLLDIYYKSQIQHTTFDAVKSLLKNAERSRLYP